MRICATWRGAFRVGCMHSACGRPFHSSRRQPGERKHELAQPYLPNDPQFRGLFLVIKGNAPAPVWEVKRNAEGRISDLRHRKTWPFVRHFYFHLIDPEWGHVTIRMCGYPPFGAQVILNGHEWVERQARRRRVTTVKDGNCFIAGSNFSGLAVWRLNWIVLERSHVCASSASAGSTRPACALRSPTRTASAAALPINIRCSNWN